MNELMIPYCGKCSNKMVQPDLFDERCSHLVGCKELSKQEWEEGNRADEEGGLVYQHNCPLNKPINE